jgi:hypothetical protein
MPTASGPARPIPLACCTRAERLRHDDQLLTLNEWIEQLPKLNSRQIVDSEVCSNAAATRSVFYPPRTQISSGELSPSCLFYGTANDLNEPPSVRRTIPTTPCDQCATVLKPCSYSTLPMITHVRVSSVIGLSGIEAAEKVGFRNAVDCETGGSRT